MKNLPRKLVLGCGNKKPEGWLGVDINNTEEVDVIQDLDESDWKLLDNHFEEVIAENLFEHLSNPVVFMEELSRICKDGAEIEIKGPHLSSNNWHDPTHKRLLGRKTFENFTVSGEYSFYSNSTFEILEKEILFAPFRKQPHKHIGYLLANNIPELFENTVLSRLLPARDIRFRIKVVK